MAEHSSIEWTDATWNPITGCTLVSDGCRHCYAATLAATRLKNLPSRAGLARINAAGEAKFTGEVRFNAGWLDQPLRWKRPRRIFVCAHGDLFHEAVPDEWIDRVFAVMALAPRHVFQVLTKRPERAREYFARDATGFMAAEARIEHFSKRIARERGAPVPVGKTLTGTMPWHHVWFGTSAEDQATADARIPHLLAIPAAVRFVSAEPLLGPVDLTEVAAPRPDLRASVIYDALRGTGGFGERQGRLDWVIVGGESGPHARPMHPDWARSLRDQCNAARVPYFFKQWGEFVGGDAVRGWYHYANGTFTPDSGHDWGDGHASLRVGKSTAGRLLGGREWNETPESGHAL